MDSNRRSIELLSRGGCTIAPGAAGSRRSLDAKPKLAAPPPKPDTKPTGSEFLLFDKKGLQFTAADKGFHALVNPNDPLPVKNWSATTTASSASAT